MKKEKVVIVIPAYNEEKVIGRVVEDIKREGFSNIVVVDDGSTDKTSLQASKSGVLVLRHIINLGQGAALQTGFDYFLKKTDGEICVTYDADGQFEVKDIKKFMKEIKEKNFDVVLGSRFLGKAFNIPLTKKMVLKIGILFTRIFSGINLSDTHNGFRAFKREALKKIKITQNGMAHASEIIHQIYESDLRYKEIPVNIYYGQYHKIKGQKISNSLNIVFNLIFDRIFK